MRQGGNFGRNLTQSEEVGMFRYIVRRLLMMIPVILGIIFIVFAILDLTPGDPIRMLMSTTASEEAIQARREALGLNDPFFVRYARFVINAVQGDFGRNYQNNMMVSDLIFARLPVTLTLSICGIFVALLIGIPLGVLSATRQYSIEDGVSRFFAMVIAAVPGFWLGLMLILLFSVKLHWLPSFGTMNGVKSYILPSIALGASYSATLIRLTRSTMLEVVRQDYITTARAKGATEFHIIRRHALKNALIPVITVAGVFFGGMLGGSIIVEAVFGLPGLGSLLLDGITMKDMPLVLGGVTVLAVAFSMINLIVDLLYAILDPRVKAQYKAMYPIRLRRRHSNEQ